MSTTTIPTQPVADPEGSLGPQVGAGSGAITGSVTGSGTSTGTASDAGSRSDMIFSGVAGQQRPLSVLHGVEVNVSVEIGRTKATVKDLLALQVGSVIELDRPAGSPVDLLANNTLIAKGEIVVIDDEFALRITQILDPAGIEGS